MSREAQARARAARNLKEILSGRRTTDWAATGPNQTSLSLELTYGCLRHYFSLAAQIDPLLTKPLRPRDGDVYGLLLAGAYQLQSTRIPPHAALFETVAAVELLGKAWAKGLVNAVLRKLPRTPPEPGDGTPGLDATPAGSRIRRGCARAHAGEQRASTPVPAHQHAQDRRSGISASPGCRWHRAYRHLVARRGSSTHPPASGNAARIRQRVGGGPGYRLATCRRSTTATRRARAAAARRLRRTGRQALQADRSRPWGWRSRPSTTPRAASRRCATWPAGSATSGSSATRRMPPPSIGGMGRRSTMCCSTRPVPVPAHCAGTPKSRCFASRRTSPAARAASPVAGKSVAYVRLEGTLLYCTCSILAEGERSSGGFVSGQARQRPFPPRIAADRPRRPLWLATAAAGPPPPTGSTWPCLRNALEYSDTGRRQGGRHAGRASGERGIRHHRGRYRRGADAGAARAARYPHPWPAGLPTPMCCAAPVPRTPTC